MAQPMVDVGRPVSPKVYSLALTSAGDGTASGTVTVEEPWLYQVELVPGTGGDAPTAFTTCTVKTPGGCDLLSAGWAGKPVNEDTVTPFLPPIYLRSGNRTLTVAATGMGDSNKATVYVVTA